MTWYVVADGDINVDYRKVWTVSRDPDVPGWETDSSCDNYGLWKKDAKFLTDAANEKEHRDAVAASWESAHRAEKDRGED